MDRPRNPFPEDADASGPYPAKFAKLGLTFDDVLLLPAESGVVPADVDTSTRLTPHIELALPIVSAAMDTVTEAPLAIAMARAGGIGIVHRNLSVDDQVAEVDKVKRSQSGMIVDPVTLPPDAPVDVGPGDHGEVPHLRRADHRPRRPARGHPHQPRPPLRRRRRPAHRQRHAAAAAGHRLGRHHARSRPRTSSGRTASRSCPSSTTTASSAASSPSRTSRSAPSTPTGHPGRAGPAAGRGRGGCRARRARAGRAARRRRGRPARRRHRARPLACRARRGEARSSSRFAVDIIAGNVATASATEALLEVGADAVKVGIGPGSICTTRVVAGVGVPQITAIYDCAEAASRHGAPHHRRRRHPVLGRHRQGHRRRCRRGHARRPARRASTRARARSSCTRASATRSTAAWARWAP